MKKTTVTSKYNFQTSRNKKKENGTAHSTLTKRTEGVLEIELGLRNLIQKSPFAIYMTDLNGYIIFYNEAAVTLWGRRPVIGKDRWCGSFKMFDLDGVTLVPIDKYPMTIALKEKRKIISDTFIVERPDGTRRYFIPHPEPFFNPEGNMIGATNMMMDITDSKMAELHSDKLAALVESSDDTIISKNLDSTITSWNKAAEKMFGYTAEEMIGQSILKLFPPERVDEETFILDQVKKGNIVKHYETKRIRKDGSELDVSVTVSAVKNAEGKIIGASKIARDITDMKKLEQRKDEFIKIASHELKTPITSIKGYVQLLLSMYSEQHAETAPPSKKIIETSLLTINKQVLKLTRLIAKLLDLSRIESGQLELNKTNFNLKELLEEVIGEASHLTSKHAIIFASSYEGMITADRDRIGQVLSNLLDNAIKYSPDADKVKVALTTKGKFANIDVTDYGIGINNKDQQKIFERFFRVEGKDEQTYPGFGIGLFITAEIIHRHNGTVTVKSEKNKGAVFTVSLPVAN